MGAIAAHLFQGFQDQFPLHLIHRIAAKCRGRVSDFHCLVEQIHRIEQSIESDPALAIGTAKELIETCCKTILAERGKPVEGTPDIPTLTKETLKELKLVPDGVPDSHRAVRGRLPFDCT